MASATATDLTKKYRPLFFGTAIYSWLTAISMLKPAGGFEAFGITPIPEENNVLHICCLFIGAFGCVYYWASRDLYANRELVWLGVALKAGNIIVAIVDVCIGTISWQYLLLLAPDMILITVFRAILREVNEQEEGKKK